MFLNRQQGRRLVAKYVSLSQFQPFFFTHGHVGTIPDCTFRIAMLQCSNQRGTLIFRTG
ncbi:hypothetical protein SRABI106_04551 [Rahnella aquatilis]|nr:hypothetical protein SRABI106_04551 [Rahnella aquatilis]